MKNNFDMSSTGINITAYAHYDNWAARDLFEEEIETYKNKFYSYQCEVARIGDFCEISDSADKQDLLDLADELSEWTSYEDWSESELREEILDANPAMIMNRFWDSEIGGSLKLKDGYNLYHTRGYSQGDVETVLYKGDSLSAEIRDAIDHLFWDSPVSAEVEINGDTFNYCEMEQVDIYEWEKDKFINWILSNYKGEKPDYVRETLERLLPDDYLDYVG